MQDFLMLIINPGSTSTKIAVYCNNKPLFRRTLRHSSDELAQFPKLFDQMPFRQKVIINAVKEAGISMNELNAVVGRGGLLSPMESGTYEVTPAMVADLHEQKRGSHASNLGGVLAFNLAKELNIPAYIVDPVCVDEMETLARISGLPEIQRESLFHALNQKATARRAARDLGKAYNECNLLVAHLGGGISVGAHFKGRVIDVTNAVGGEGPFSPERTGALPAVALAELCFSGKYSLEEIKKKLVGQGGLVAYLGTNDAAEVEKMIARGDDRARLIFEAMAYQVAKEIGSMAVVLKGDIEAVVLTGGLANSDFLVNLVRERVNFIAKVMVYPGEDEMEALAEGALKVLRGEEEAKIYGENMPLKDINSEMEPIITTKNIKGEKKWGLRRGR